MKKKIILLSIGICAITHAQIRTNQSVNENALPNSTAFLDASSAGVWNSSPLIGKGLVFPRTDLTVLTELKQTGPNVGSNFPTRMDGMIVYNTASGTAAIGGTPVVPGFYYYKNNSNNLQGGTWLPLGNGGNLASFYTQDGTLSSDREVNLDNKKLSFTGGKVGINTTDPKGTMDISYNSTWDETKPQGLNIPNVSSDQRSKFVDTKVGMLIYNTTKKCLEMYQGIVNGTPQWECMTSSSSGSSSGGSGTGSTQGNLTVSATGFEGQYLAGISLTNANKVKFTITNNGVTGINNVDFSNAVSAQNGAETIQVDGSANNSVSIAGGGQQELIYTLSGTPQQGTLTATFNKLGLQASQTTDVLTSSAAINDRNIYVMSMTYQNNNVQGKINNTSEKITVDIPYVAGQTSNAAASIVQTSAAGQNNDSNTLTLNIPAKSSNSSGKVTATLHVGEDGEYLVKQMVPGTDYTIATFNVDMGGTHYRIFIKGTGGIKDRKFDSNSIDHKFVYVPIEIVTTKGYNKTWLTMNLGAQRAKIGASGFNPDMKTYGVTNDGKLKGSYYQWQRPSDGHEFRNSQITSIKASNWQANAPSAVIGRFISASGNWVVGGENVTSGPYSEFWQAGGQNNPCPSGYHVPTKAEIQELYDNQTGGAAMNNLKLLPNLALAGLRTQNGTFSYENQWGQYWTSTPNGATAEQWVFSANNANFEETHYRGDGASVRCIKD